MKHISVRFIKHIHIFTHGMYSILVNLILNEIKISYLWFMNVQRCDG